MKAITALLKAVGMFTALLSTILHAQAPLKQITNISWGTEDDFLGSAVCKVADGTFAISTALYPNLSKKERTRANVYRILGVNGSVQFQFLPQQSIDLDNKLVVSPHIYLSNGENKIYRVHAQHHTIDSLTIPVRPLYILKRTIQGIDVLLVTSQEGWYFYDIASWKLLRQIPASEGLRVTGKPAIVGDKMYCLLKETQVGVYSLSTQKKLWSVSTSPKPAKWLGVTVGTFDDVFTSYALNKNGSVLYAVTMSGSIYKINAATGEIFKQVDRFRGDANNAGLITEFSLADVNGDGVEDLIGSAVDYNIYAISGKDLSVLWAYNTGYENQAGVALYDITGDGVVDVFTINDKMKLSIINGKTGEKIHEHQIQPEKGQAKVILADINNNGLLDVFISGGRKAIRAYEMPAVKVPVGGIFWTPEG